MAIKVKVEKTLGDFHVRIHMEIPSSGVSAIFGKSGSGKTTIINMIAGLVRPDHGLVSINGKVWSDSELGLWTPPEKRRCGYVFQDGRIFPHMSVKGNLEFGMNLVKPIERYAKLDRVAEILDITHLLGRRPSGLSGGEKQRLAIGRAILSSPRLLLMDEPLASLDEDRKDEILPFILKITEEFQIPILYVSHNINEIERIARRLINVESGAVRWYGPLEEYAGTDDGFNGPPSLKVNYL